MWLCLLATLLAPIRPANELPDDHFGCRRDRGKPCAPERQIQTFVYASQGSAPLN
jgi:hypothetical protein